MSNLVIDAVYGLMGHAKELQAQSRASQEELKNTAKALPEVLKHQIRLELNNSLGDEAKDALRALQATTIAAKSASETFQSIAKKRWLLNTLGLIAIAIVIAVLSSIVIYMLLGSRVSELKELNREIEKQEITLEALESETWGLKLDIQNGKKYIVLPNGVEVEKTGKFLEDKTDKRTVIVLK